MKTFHIIFVVCAAFLFASCGMVGLDSLLGSSSSESQEVTCETGDANCFQENFSLINEDGENIELVTLTSDTLPPASSETDNPPSFTTTAADSTMEFHNTYSFKLFYLDWEDPHGNQPAFCFKVTCNGTENCNASSTLKCSRGTRDGLVEGTWKTWLGYQAEPADSTTTEALQMQVTPITVTQDIPDGDPIGILEDAIENGVDLSNLGTEDGLVIGQTVTIDQTIESEEESDDDFGSDSGNSSSNACTSNSSCGTSLGCAGQGVCTSDGCRCCLYVSFQNSCLSCSSNSDCDANTTCVEGVCVF